MTLRVDGSGPRPRRVLNGISDVRAFFRTNPVPLYFASPTPFNLLRIYRWVRNFYYLTYFDSFERTHPRVFVPQRHGRRDFGRMEDVCNHVLSDPETFEFIAHRGPGGKACFVIPNQETKTLVHNAGAQGRAAVGVAGRAPGLQDRHDAPGRGGGRADGASCDRAGRLLREAAGARAQRRAGR